jgi:hypothetical protein
MLTRGWVFTPTAVSVEVLPVMAPSFLTSLCGRVVDPKVAPDLLRGIRHEVSIVLAWGHLSRIWVANTCRESFAAL